MISLLSIILQNSINMNIVFSILLRLLLIFTLLIFLVFQQLSENIKFNETEPASLFTSRHTIVWQVSHHYQIYCTSFSVH